MSRTPPAKRAGKPRPGSAAPVSIIEATQHTDLFAKRSGALAEFDVGAEQGLVKFDIHKGRWIIA
jgi:hypothetical protein